MKLIKFLISFLSVLSINILAVNSLVITILVIMFLPNHVWAEELPPFKPPIGIYNFQEELLPKFSLKSKIFFHNKQSDQDKIKDLSKQGYWCFRRSTTQTNCQLKKTFTEFPDGVLDKTKSLLKKYEINFPENYEIELYHNGSSREWLIHGNLSIGEYTNNIYRITVDESGVSSISFPVDEENSFGVLYVHEDQKYGFPLTVSIKDSEDWKTTFYFEALYLQK